MNPNSLTDAVTNGSLLLAIPVALFAGLISFASPCVLPLVPGYLGYVGGVNGTSGNGRKIRTLAGVGLFILGFSVVFVAYGAAFGSIGSWLLHWQNIIVRIMGAAIVVMGLLFIGVFPRLQRTVRIPITPVIGLAGAPVLGMVFGLGWTPCLGPTLAAISALSLDTASTWRGALLAFIYCLGLGIPFLLLAFGFNWASSAFQWLRRYRRTINIAGGALLIAIGSLMLTGVWTALLYLVQSWIGGVVLPL